MRGPPRVPALRLDAWGLRAGQAQRNLLNRVGVRMGELFSRRIASYGVTLPMYRVLAALWESAISD